MLVTNMDFSAQKVETVITYYLTHVLENKKSVPHMAACHGNAYED